PRDPSLTADRTKVLERLLGPRERQLVLAANTGHRRPRHERLGADLGVDRLRAGEERLDPPLALDDEVLIEPDHREGTDEPQAELGLSALQHPGERGANVVPLGAKAFLYGRLLWAQVVELHRLSHLGHVLRMTSSDHAGLAGLFQPLDGVLADRLEHREPFALATDQALVEQGGERVEVGLADLLGGVQREAAREDAEPPEELLLLLRAQLVAPLDRRAQGSLALGEVAPRGRQDGGAAAEPPEELAGRQGLDAPLAPPPPQLDGQRKAAQAAADLRQPAVVGGEPGQDGFSPLTEELDRRRF